MPRVTVTSGGGSARYGSKCQACNGYGDIQKLRSEWLCMPCRMNRTTILTARNTAKQRKDAQLQISDRRAANARAAAQAAQASKEGLLVRRRRNAVHQRPETVKTGAAKKARKQQSIVQVVGTAVDHAKVAKHPKQKPPGPQPASETIDSARARLQQQWNSRLG